MHEITDAMFTALDLTNQGHICADDALHFTKQLLAGLTFTDHDEFNQQQRAPDLLKSLLPN